MTVSVGIFPPNELLMGNPAGQAAWLDEVDRAGVDHVCVGDHVSFIIGIGFDGLILATSLSVLHPTLPVHTGVYLLVLRNPVTVARQLSSLATLAPGRLVLGVGIGGEDRHEVEICGVDPATRGRRMDESLTILRGLLTGSPVDFDGEFFQISKATILPPPPKPIPIIVGGRSDAAIRRAGRLGDGWLSIWKTPEQYRSAMTLIEKSAADAGRSETPRHNALQVWCGFGSSREEGRSMVAPAMQSFYQVPFERFEKYTPYGTPEEVAEFLAPFADAGCSTFDFITQAPDTATALNGVAEVKRLLNQSDHAR